jgi:hypothetical protein
MSERGTIAVRCHCRARHEDAVRLRSYAYICATHFIEAGRWLYLYGGYTHRRAGRNFLRQALCKAVRGNTEEQDSDHRLRPAQCALNSNVQ